LRRVAATLPKGALFLVGVDTKKDRAVLERAYDDKEGVTAAFNLNLLTRINRELDGNFDPARFAHRAVYNDALGRIEMHLTSIGTQAVRISGRRFHFTDGETIHTENSYKYSAPQFATLAASAGWSSQRLWTDADNLFALHLLENVRAR
jgi:L-histidine N-alpha-methyltransferase